MNKKVKTALGGVLKAFEDGNIPQAMAHSCDIPCNDWSLMNRLLVFIRGSIDARGIRRWNKEGRIVKKGSKALYIPAPNMKKRKETDEAGQEKETAFISGFLPVPVFKMEDTTGDPLDYEQLWLPELLLLDVAKTWGITVKAVGKQAGFLGRYKYSPSNMDNENIILCSPNEAVFFHELAHAIHRRTNMKLAGGQQWNQEVVAELTAAVLCRAIGKEPGEEVILAPQIIKFRCCQLILVFLFNK